MRIQTNPDNIGITDYENPSQPKYSKTREGFLYENAFVFDKEDAGKFEEWLRSFVGEKFVVELGCGSGVLSNFCKEYVGLDANVDGGKNCIKEYYVVDLCSPYGFDPPIEADILLSFGFFEHIEEDRIMDVLIHADKLLKPGSKIFFSIDNRHFYGTIGHITLKDSDWWDQKFQEIGWIKEEMSEEFIDDFFSNIPSHWGEDPSVRGYTMIFLYRKEIDNGSMEIQK